jgi:hypothetical protein
MPCPSEVQMKFERSEEACGRKKIMPGSENLTARPPSACAQKAITKISFLGRQNKKSQVIK